MERRDINAQQAALSNYAELVSGTGEEFPESFAGTDMTDNGVAVFTVAPDADMREAIASLPNPDGFTVEFVEKANTLWSLTQLTEAITDDRHAWKDQGVPLVQWGPDLMRNQVVVHLHRYSEQAADALYDRYGRARLLVFPEDMEPPVQF